MTEVQAKISLTSPVRGDAYTLVPTLWSSVIMAVAGIGDALLYAYLPVKGEALGMSVLTVGVLLSINKLTRIFTNSWTAWLSDRWGVRNVLLLGTILSAATTLAYANDSGTWLWIFSRIVWGLSYSALRFSTFQYAGKSARKGRAFGIGRSIQEIGPLLAYWIGPIMINELGPAITFTCWSALTVMLLPAFGFLPDLKISGQNIKPLNLKLPVSIDIWSFLSSFVVEGVLIVGISRLVGFDADGIGDLLILSALYISSRRLMNIIISPVSGLVGDKFDFKTVFDVSCAVIIVGLCVVALGYPKTGILIVFAGSAFNMTLTPIVSVALVTEQRGFDALTRMSTSRDIGSALGSLTGIYLLSVLHVSLLFTILAFALVLVCLKISTLHRNHE